MEEQLSGAFAGRRLIEERETAERRKLAERRSEYRDTVDKLLGTAGSLAHALLKRGVPPPDDIHTRLYMGTSFWGKAQYKDTILGSGWLIKPHEGTKYSPDFYTSSWPVVYLTATGNLVTYRTGTDRLLDVHWAIIPTESGINAYLDTEKRTGISRIYDGMAALMEEHGITPQDLES